MITPDGQLLARESPVSMGSDNLSTSQSDVQPVTQQQSGVGGADVKVLTQHAQPSLTLRPDGQVMPTPSVIVGPDGQSVSQVSSATQVINPAQGQHTAVASSQLAVQPGQSQGQIVYQTQQGYPTQVVQQVSSTYQQSQPTVVQGVGAQQVYYTAQGTPVVVQQPQQVYSTTQVIHAIDSQGNVIQQAVPVQQATGVQQPILAPRDPREPPPPPPSPPPKGKVKLPPNWKMAHDGDGKTYYYHTVTRQTQWDPPEWDQGEHEDMDIGSPTVSEVSSGKSRRKTTTAAADTSSEVAKRMKDQFRIKMSQHIVVCLNPYRRPDCKMGRINSTDDFKHLARKLTHAVLSKELKHCRHPEDLEVNENVKSKAKDYVKKYMGRFGPTYKKSANSP